MPDTVSIPRQLNGPLDSGQGGYSAGVVAAFVDGPAEVSLRRPVPLERALDVVRDDDGSVRLLDGDDLVAEGRPVGGGRTSTCRRPSSVEEARDGDGPLPRSRDGPFSRCFVCGLAREDSFGVFAGEVAGAPHHGVAVDSARLGGRRRRARPARIRLGGARLPRVRSLRGSRATCRWGCSPGFSVRIDAPVTAGAEHVVIGWPIEIDGRKHHAGGAVFASTAPCSPPPARSSSRPGTHPADPLDADPQPDARRRIVHRRELDVRSELHVRELLQQLGRTALLDRCAPAHDEVLAQPGRVDLRPLERDRHARIAPDIVELALVRVEVGADQIVAVDADPDTSHVRRRRRDPGSRDGPVRLTR